MHLLFTYCHSVLSGTVICSFNNLIEIKGKITKCSFLSNIISSPYLLHLTYLCCTQQKMTRKKQFAGTSSTVHL